MAEIEKKLTGIGSGNHPISQATLIETRNQRIVDSKARKNRLLKTILKTVKTNVAKNGNNHFPDIVNICFDLNIPYSRFRAWKMEDSDFKAKYDEIERLYIEKCKVRVFNSSQEKGGGWLALEILRQKDEEWKQKANNQFYTQINLVTNLRSDNDILGNAEEIPPQSGE